jgi:hypothetical protein
MKQKFWNPDFLATDQSSTGMKKLIMPKPIQDRIRRSRQHFMVRYRTGVRDDRSFLDPDAQL